MNVSELANHPKIQLLLDKITRAEAALSAAGDSAPAMGAAITRLENAKIALADVILNLINTPDQKESK